MDSSCLLIFFDLWAVLYVLANIAFYVFRTLKAGALIENVKIYVLFPSQPLHFFPVHLQLLFLSQATLTL